MNQKNTIDVSTNNLMTRAIPPQTFLSRSSVNIQNVALPQVSLLTALALRVRANFGAMEGVYSSDICKWISTDSSGISTAGPPHVPSTGGECVDALSNIGWFAGCDLLLLPVSIFIVKPVDTFHRGDDQGVQAGWAIESNRLVFT